jgi:hypothetical protein
MAMVVENYCATTGKTKVEPLPFIHVKDHASFCDKIHGCVLETRQHAVGENTREIICFSYGRAVYVPDDPIKLKTWRPMGIGFVPARMSISDVYPFDTGVYTDDKGGFRATYFPAFNQSEISLFALGNSLSSIQDYVHCIFGSNKAYISAKTKLKVFPGRIVNCLIKMIASVSQIGGLLEGAECIEIQSKMPIPINATNAAILFLCVPGDEEKEKFDKFKYRVVLSYDEAAASFPDDLSRAIAHTKELDKEIQLYEFR